MSKAKTLEIEELTRHKEGELNIDSSTYHIWLCSIATNKVLVEKQEKIEALQIEIKSLNVEVMEREENGISQLMEKVKGK